VKVSVLVPTRERLAMLRECVASIRAQTYGELEILISDDGKDEETPRFVREQCAADGRVRLLPRNPSPGLFSNFNHLLDHARGDAFLIVCDDDRLLPGCVERLVKALVENPTVVAVCAEFWFMDVEGRRLEEASRVHVEHAVRVGLEEGIWHRALQQALIAKINVGCALFRSSALGRERFDLRSMTAADIDFWIRTARTGPVYYIPERLSEIRAHAQAISAGRIEPIAEGIIYTMEKHAGVAPEYEVDRLRVLQIFRAAYAWAKAAEDPAVAR
jgi:glycosyltransferase involved in cell wall biosynthesis